MNLATKIKFILNGGVCKIGVESTILNITNKPKILRYGGLSFSKIKKRNQKNNNFQLNPKKISAPGQLKLHYSPGLPIKLNVKKNKKIILYTHK